MKTILLSVALIVFGFAASGQDVASKPIRLRIGAGVTMATGDFKKTDVNNDKSGYAKNGIFYSMSLVKDVHSNVAIGLTFAKGTNKFNKETYKQHFIRSGVHPIIKADNYKFTHMTADLYGQVPVNNSAFYAKASLGLGFLTAGDIEATVYRGDQKITLSREDKRAPSIVAGLGAGFRQDFGKFGAGIEIAYTHGKLKFDESYKQPISTVNSTLGLYYRLSK